MGPVGGDRCRCDFLRGFLHSIGRFQCRRWERIQPVVATFDGEAITQQDYIAVYNEVSPQAFLSMGRWPEQIGYNIEQEIPNRLMMIQELDNLGIVVGPEAVAKYKANAFSDPETGAFQKGVI